MSKKQVHIFYSGVVQGVGFRYRTQMIARNLYINGWVKNLPDGRVEVLAQAAKDKLDEFILQLESTFNFYIKDRQMSWQEAESTITDFRIKF